MSSERTIFKRHYHVSTKTRPREVDQKILYAEFVAKRIQFQTIAKFAVADNYIIYLQIFGEFTDTCGQLQAFIHSYRLHIFLQCTVQYFIVQK